MNNLTLNSDGRLLREQLHAVRLHHEAVRAYLEKAPKLHVAGVGNTLASTYEFIRNAAENTEEHLLLGRAIRRFYSRSLSFHLRQIPSSIGEELVVELTQSNYLKNGAIALRTVEEIEQAIHRRHELFWQLKDTGVAHSQAESWVLDVLSVETERMLGIDHLAQNVFVHFAHSYYRKIFQDEISPGQEYSFDLSLLVAIHKSLLRSDTATVRYEVQNLYLRNAPSVEAVIDMNRQVDDIYYGVENRKLERGVAKHGAPLRILKEMVNESESIDVLLDDPSKFLAAYETQLQTAYDNISMRLKRGIIKSIIFLFITKVLVGLAIEIPYDMLVYGYIAWMPLAINILFPPLYMASLKWSLKLPGIANRQATVNAMEKILYNGHGEYKVVQLKQRKVSVVMSVVYAMMFVVSFSVVVLCLATLGFNIVQGAIFLLFFSTASFLGFRLSRMVREVEVFASRKGMLDVLRDFIYTPFVMVGRWISDKYAHVNILTIILDRAIELPLKTILRLMRQWIRFLNDKHDEL